MEEKVRRGKGRPLQIEWSETADTLKTLYLAECDVKRRSRLHALWLLRTGKSITEVSQLLAIPYRTIQRWLTFYRQGGLKAALKRTQGAGPKGGRGYLSVAQEAIIKAGIEADTWQTATEVQQWMADEWGIQYTIKGVYSLLDRLRR